MITEGKAIDGIIRILEEFENEKRKHILSYVTRAVEKDQALFPKKQTPTPTAFDFSRVTRPQQFQTNELREC